MYSEIVSTVRDLTVISLAIYLTATFKPLASSAKTFLVRASEHFAFMEQKVETATNNHLQHIQKALETLVEKSEN